MNPAALPGGSDQNLGDRLLEAEVRVGGDQADPAQTAADQLPEKGPPELQVLGWTDVDPDHLALTGGLNADRDQDRHRDHQAALAHLLKVASSIR
jgi:hypothetical protein